MKTAAKISFFLAFMLSLFAGEYELVAGENGVPKTLEEAEARRDKVLARVNQGGKISPDSRIQWALPLLRFLDSDNPAIRAVAIDAFPDLYGIHLDECIPYLVDPKHPLTERMPLLVLCTKQLGGYGESYSGKGTVQKVKEFVREVLGAEVCPPMFAQLTVVLASKNYTYGSSGNTLGMSTFEVLPEGGAELAAKRFLSVTKEVRRMFPLKGYGKQHYFNRAAEKVFEMVIALGEENAGPAIEDWYRTENDPDARRVVVEKSLPWSKLPEWAERRKAVLELAANDWDEDIATKAKALLAGAKE